MNIKKIYGPEALSIFIKPPSIEELESRLQKRSTETPDKIEMRINKAKKELQFAGMFDAVIVNDNLQIALKEAENLVSGLLTGPESV